jgi:hypothetical protein
MKRSMYILMAALAGFAAIQIAACGGGSTGSGGTTSLRVALTDKNSDLFSSVFVSIREVRVVPTGKEGLPDGDPALPLIASFSTPISVDVMTLGPGKALLQRLLGEAVIPPGSYSQVRLVLEANPSGQGRLPVNYVTLASDPSTRIPLTTPSGQESGLKVLGPFEVKAGEINAIMLDFDPNTAIVARGNGGYNVKPTGIRIVQVSDPSTLTDFGSITGGMTSFSSWSTATLSVVPRGSSSSIASGLVFSSYSGGRWRGTYSAFVPGGTYRLFVKTPGFLPYSSPVTTVTAGAAASLPDFTLLPVP